MKKFIIKIKDKLTSNHPEKRAGEFRISRTTDEAIKFTITHYGDTFRDLAKYDRGESYSS